ncbi:MAG: hypothetical protein ACSHYB_19340 [Roseibacillus sp.]
MAHRDTPATFPIPKDKILIEKSKAIASSPLTWVAAVGAIVALALLPNLYGLAIATGVIFGTAALWKKRMPQIEDGIVAALIESSNKAQTRSLKKGVEQLKDWDYEDYADQLTEILALKKQVEGTIHSQTPRTSTDESIESLVDTLCNEVSRDLFKMADINYTLRKKRKRLSDQQKKEMRSDQEELGERVKQATLALKEAHAQLALTTGKRIPDKGDNPLLDQTIERLREESALAQRIRARIETTYVDTLEVVPETTSTTSYSSPNTISH